MMWARSHRADRAALRLADRHYNRQKIGSPQFVPPGRCVVLLTPERDALWTTSWPFAAYVKHAWAGAWLCSLFRNEGPSVASEMIVAAVAATRYIWPDVPPLGMVTFVDPRKVPGFFKRTAEGRVLEWGYSYQQAGFIHADPPYTKSGLVALQLHPGDMPAPAAPLGELSLTAGVA
jgi:hypothetical protein